MKKNIFILAFFLFFELYFKIYSQPNISYIIPDIGTPGMNTYIEIIAPYSAEGAFGSDGFYLNNSNSTVRVECLNSADNQKIVFGPIVVSWLGRLISTQVFVNPNLQTNHWDWTLLNSEWKIPIRVFVQGSGYSNVDTFFIVNPFPFGNRSTDLTNTVIGQMPLGKRSKRGAMIVDSMILANTANYTISLSDPDNNLINGNQGFLPFILLSKGAIRGAGSSTKISGSANGKHGGPGGGGGGGSYCDNSGSGESGGDGFTGGGPGGWKHISSSGRQAPGKGSGSAPSSGIYGGISLNYVNGGNAGVPQPNPEVYESAGGGTGHPFGLSGDGCMDGGICNPTPGYGAGAGYRQNTAGGSAGYSVNGGGTIPAISGKEHGNSMVVPIAGGSGGASGNPQAFPWGCSGNGGGGGGAVQIFGRSILNLNIDAKGGYGGDGNNAPGGGGGSGGYIGVFTKLGYTMGVLDVTGGNRGASGGRIRYDTPTANFLTFQGNNNTVYRGLTTDTTFLVMRQFTITGSRQNNINLRAFLKPQSSGWTEIFGFQYAGNYWSLPITLPLPDTLFYFVVLQEVPNPSNVPYKYEPSYVFSQSSANIFKVDRVPVIKGDSTANFRLIGCSGLIDRDTIVIRNEGDATLLLQLNNAYFKYGNRGFDYFPKTLRNILPGGSDTVYLVYNYQAGQSGYIRDTLFIPHNDNLSGRNPWKVALEAKVDTLSLLKLPVNYITLNEIDTIKLGKICISSAKDTTFYIRNVSEINITLNSINISPLNFLTTDFQAPKFLPTNANELVRLSFIPSIPGTFIYKVVLSVQECPTFSDTLVVIGEAVEAKIRFSRDTVDFGKICLKTSKDTIIKVYNNSVVGFVLNEIVVENPSDFQGQFIASNILNLNDSVLVRVTFNANTDGEVFGKLIFTSIDCPTLFDTLILKGESIGSKLEFIGNSNFKTIRVGKKDTLTIELTNSGSGKARIEKLPILAPPFKFINAPSVPFELNKNDRVSFTIEFSPSFVGEFFALMKVLTIQLGSEYCLDSTDVLLYGKAVKTEVEVLNNPTNFGILAYCQTRLDTIYFINKTEVEITITKFAQIIGQDAISFKLIEQPSLPYTLKSLDTAKYIVLFDGYTGIYDVKNAQLEITIDDELEPILLVDLIGTKAEIKLAYNSTITFGNVPIGDFKEITETITNNSLFNVRIANIFSNNSDITITPTQGIIVANGGMLSINIRKLFTKVGQNYDTIYVAVSEPCADTFAIYSTGIGIEGTALIPSKIIFDTVFYCEKDSKRLVIKNTGPSAFSITSLSILGADRNLFKFATTPILPINVKRSDSVALELLFEPGDVIRGEKQAQLYLETSLSALPSASVSLIGFKEDISLEFLPAELNFGAVAIGTQKTVPLTIRNTLLKRINISNFYTKSGIINVVPDSVSLQEYIGTESVQVSITLNNVGLYVDTIFVIIDYPCQDTLLIPVSATGIEGAIDYSSQLNFGIVPFCETSRKEFWLENMGENIVQIISMEIDGVDKDCFYFEDTVNIWLPLQKGDVYRRGVIFDPINTVDGIKRAIIRTKVFMNLREVEIITNLVGERRSGLLATPPEINFSKTVINTTKRVNLVIENKESFPISIIDILPFAYPSVFSTIPSNLNITLAPSEKYTIQVQFSPDDIIDYIDTLKLQIHFGNCFDIRKVILRGSGAPQKSIKIWLQNFDLVDLKRASISVPIYAKIDGGSDDSLVNVSFQAKLVYRDDVFYPINLTKGSLSRNSISEYYSECTIVVDSVWITPKDTLISQINAFVLLGSVDTTELRWSEFSWTRGSEQIGGTILENGFIRVKVCEAGGKRLLKQKNNVTLWPNPAQDYIVLEIENYVVPINMLEIYSNEGLMVYQKKFDSEGLIKNTFKVFIETKRFNSGFYYLLLKSPNEVMAIPLIILR